MILAHKPRESAETLIQQTDIMPKFAFDWETRTLIAQFREQKRNCKSTTTIAGSLAEWELFKELADTAIAAIRSQQ